MGTSAAKASQTPDRSRLGPAQKVAILMAKAFVTVACFWYISRQIDWPQVLSTVPLLDVRWAALAILITMLEIPVLGMRWQKIANALFARDQQMPLVPTVAATAVGMFFAQVLPSVAGDGVRGWLLVRLGSDWRNAVTSVVIDRGVGVGLLLVFGFVVLLLPSGLGAMGDYHDVVLVLYGALIAIGTVGVLLGPKIVAVLIRWRYSRWFAKLIEDAHRILFGSKGPVILSIGCVIYPLSILVVWSVARAQGFYLSLPDAALLLAIMIGVMTVPISIAGWGLRELAVISLLTTYGIAPERALLFSVSFGIVLAAGSLPGALVWVLYPFRPPQRSTEGSE
jgi:uncharacterized membrane protein YbhN (UPF0104 family)